MQVTYLLWVKIKPLVKKTLTFLGGVSVKLKGRSIDTFFHYNSEKVKSSLLPPTILTSLIYF